MSWFRLPPLVQHALVPFDIARDFSGAGFLKGNTGHLVLKAETLGTPGLWKMKLMLSATMVQVV